MRGRGENVYDICYCCAGLGRICDGVSDVRRACRDEIRRGANHIKLMVSGGASSPTDRIDSTQFSIEEIRAAVEEADAANIYVMAHAYTARAANRALENGVRSIEHANLIDDSTRKILKEKNAFVVPTMITHQVATEIGHKIGLPPAMIEKTLQVVEAGRREHALSHKAGVKMAFGTDLLGEMHVHQLREFEMRSAFQDPIDTWRAATLTAAELFNMSGVIGVVRQGAHADLLVYDRNPLEDLGAVMAPEEHLKFIAKGGLIAKNAL
jgi:imidazolonepropionase-like amidohydrolase